MAKPLQLVDSANNTPVEQPIGICSVEWYEQHEALSYHLLHMAAKVMAAPSSSDTDANAQQVGQAHGALRRHAQLVMGNAVPVVLARDGVHTIAFEQLTEARAKVAVLTSELKALRASTAASQALQANDQASSASTPNSTQLLDDQEFAAGRGSMHTEITALLTRTLARFSKAASRYPQIAVELEQIASTVTVAQKKIEELKP